MHALLKAVPVLKVSGVRARSWGRPQLLRCARGCPGHVLYLPLLGGVLIVVLIARCIYGKFI